MVSPFQIENHTQYCRDKDEHGNYIRIHNENLDCDKVRQSLTLEFSVFYNYTQTLGIKLISDKKLQI